MKGSVADVALRQAVKDALATQGLIYGKDWDFEILPNDHPIYHSYYDFDGAPFGAVNIPHHGFGPQPAEGVTIDGRLIVFYTNMDYGCAWNYWSNINPTISFQFGVNTIVFALTQEGSITKRIMNNVKY